MSQQHLIASQVFDFRFCREMPQREVHDRIKMAFLRTGLPVLEQVFNETTQHTGNVRVERLEIDLGLIVSDDIEVAFKDGFDDKVQTSLREAMRGAKEQIVDTGSKPASNHAARASNATIAPPAAEFRSDAREAEIAEFVLHFLRTGCAPWWSMAGLSRDASFALSVGQRAASLFTDNSAFRVDLCRTMISGVKSVLRRITNEAWLQPLAVRIREEGLADMPSDDVVALRRHGINPLDIDETLRIYAIAILQGADEIRASRCGPKDQSIAVDGSAWTPGPAEMVSVPGDGAKAWQSPASDASKAEILFVERAGFFLLQPFIAAFFEELGFINDRWFDNETTRTRAVRALEYLGWGTSDRPEFALQFEKYLCGCPTGSSLTNVVLTPAEGHEVDAVLEAVIKHWTALGSTSCDSLRQTFLQRNGKLFIGDDQDRLIVEQSSVDVLLDRIPWSFGAVKLPWMKRPLIVEWR